MRGIASVCTVAVAYAAFSTEVVAERPVANPHIQLNVGEIDAGRLENLKNTAAARFEASKAYVIQLDGPMTEARRAALRARGFDWGNTCLNRHMWRSWTA